MGEREVRQQWEAVGVAIRQRMVELAMSQSDIAHVSGVSRETVRPIMNGEPTNARPQTLAKISRALGWPGDHIDRVLRGEEPASPEPHSEPTIADVLAEVRALREAVAQLQQSSQDTPNGGR